MYDLRQISLTVAGALTICFLRQSDRGTRSISILSDNVGDKTSATDWRFGSRLTGSRVLALAGHRCNIEMVHEESNTKFGFNQY